MRILIIRVVFLFVHLVFSLAIYQDASSLSNDANENTIKIGKCCELNEMMVDGRCTPIKETRRDTKPWKPEFRNEDGHPLAVEPNFELKVGLPKCKSNETGWDIYNSSKPHMDLVMILPSGKLRHYSQCHLDEPNEAQELDVEENNSNNKVMIYDYEFGTYCADKIILSNDKNPIVYARVCVPPNKRVMQADVVMRRVIDPTFRAISIACYLVVAVVYFVLPQLRNLIGNIITSMTLCLVISQCANMVRIFTEFSSHVSFLIADTVTYVSLLAAFFWLNSLGYYIWKTFRSRNIFLRLTDGRKYCYYSIYVWSSTVIMGAMATFAHFVLDTNKPIIIDTPSVPQETIGWLGIAVFFTPVAFTIILNIWFIVTTVRSIERMNAYGRIHHKMKYSFRMFVFLFIIMAVTWLFTLLSWIRYELVYCYIVVNLLQAILILYICVFGQKRVTFMLRKTCNCYSPSEMTHGLDWGEEMTAMNMG